MHWAFLFFFRVGIESTRCSQRNFSAKRDKSRFWKRRLAENSLRALWGFEQQLNIGRSDLPCPSRGDHNGAPKMLVHGPLANFLPVPFGGYYLASLFRAMNLSKPSFAARTGGEGGYSSRAGVSRAKKNPHTLPLGPHSFPSF